MAPYRPPGRSNRSGRTTADNDVFEGLPVKQWGQSFSRVSLAPPVVQPPKGQDDKWADPPMPRDFQLLQPWTQQLLRLARSGKVGTKRKQDPDSQDEEKGDDDGAEDTNKLGANDRGYVMRRWKPVPESMLEPEHKHFEFLAKRRKGLTSQSTQDVPSTVTVTMRKTKVQKADANGEVTVYEALVPEGQIVQGELTAATELADLKPVLPAPGTIIEGVGVANEDGVVVAEHLKPGNLRHKSHSRKKNGGPGRGKKRVTFTNPDGSTYTTVVPNATKIVPEPGQTVKHIAKDQEATADVTAEQAAAAAVTTNPDQTTDGAEDGSRSEDGDDDSDDDDREDGELSDEDAPRDSATPAPVASGQQSAPTTAEPMEDVQSTTVAEVVGQPSAEEVPTGLPEAPPPIAAPVEAAVVDIPMIDAIVPEKITAVSEVPTIPPPAVEPPESDLTDPLSSPEKTLSRASPSRQGSEVAPLVSTVAAEAEATSVTEGVPVVESVSAAQPPPAVLDATVPDGAVDNVPAVADPEQPLKPPTELPVEPPIEAPVESPLTEEPAMLGDPLIVAKGEEQGAMTETANAPDSVAIPEPEHQSQVDTQVTPLPALEPASAPQPLPLPPTEPTMEPPVKPSEEPSLQTAVEQTTEPAPALKTVADSDPKSVALPASEPAPEPSSKPASLSAPEPASLPTPKPASEHVPETATALKDEPPTQPSAGSSLNIDSADAPKGTTDVVARSEPVVEDTPPVPVVEADAAPEALQFSEATRHALEWARRASESAQRAEGLARALSRAERASFDGSASSPSALDSSSDPSTEAEDDILGDLEKHLEEDENGT